MENAEYNPKATQLPEAVYYESCTEVEREVDDKYNEFIEKIVLDKQRSPNDIFYEYYETFSYIKELRPQYDWIYNAYMNGEDAFKRACLKVRAKNFNSNDIAKIEIKTYLFPHLMLKKLDDWKEANQNEFPKNETTSHVVKGKKKGLDEEVLQDFDELFEDKRFIEPCYHTLRELELIDGNNTYISNLKSAICVWIKELKLSKIPFNKLVSDVTYTRLLNNKFKGLDIEVSSFRQKNKRANDKYKTEFKVLLSQVSQSVKL